MMSRTWKSIFSVLLAAALLLPVAPAARADQDGVSGAPGEPGSVEAESIEFRTGNNTLYYRGGKAVNQITVTADVTPSAYTGDITWTFEKGEALVNVLSQDTQVKNGAAAITLEAVGSAAGSVTLKAAVGDHEDSTSIVVAEDEIVTAGVKFANDSLSVQAKKTVTLGLSPEPSYVSGIGKPTVTYKSSDDSVASVSGNVVTGKIAGKTVTITAWIDDTIELKSSKATITVVAPSASLAASKATLGTPFSMEDIYYDLRAKFRDTYNQDPESIQFSYLGVHGTLKLKNDDVKRDTYGFSYLKEMFLDPTGEGDFECRATLINGDNKLSVDFTVTVSAPTVTIQIPIDSGANYSFGWAGVNANGKTGAQIIKEAIGKTFGSLLFESISSSSSNVGALYTSASVSNSTRVSKGTTVQADVVDELYFTPSRAGTYTVSFTAYAGSNGSGSVVCRGNLVLPVDGTSLDITVNLNSVTPFTFSETPSGSSMALHLQINNVINSSMGGSSWGGIKFDGAASASSTGTLHESSSHSRAISAGDYISKTAISKLYYVPVDSGTYVITYGVYADANSTRAISTGTLTIKTSTIPAGMSDVTYTTSVKDSVTLQEDDFLNFFRTSTTSKHQLSYVVFNEYDGGGTFYHGASSFLPYNSADFYTSTYTGSVPANARYLDRLSFTAPSAAGYTAVLFTCYGGVTPNSAGTKVTGKLCIFYTADDVPTVSYNAFNVVSVDLKENDFVTTYNAAMKSSINRPSFAVQLLNAPSKGTLYYYYGSNSNSRRALNSSNIKNYTFSVNSSSGVSVEELSYEPGYNTSGTDTITYLVTSSGGELLYVGTIQFKLSSDLTVNITNDGYFFQLSDFYNAREGDPVVYVTFPQPSAGKVYVSTGDRFIAVSADTRLYTVAAADGQYPLINAFYAPRANETGEVTLKYSLHRRSGVTNSGLITVNVLSKASSSTFGDVGGTMSWAANSIDFAYRMGLVNGTDTSVKPPLFTPAGNMRRRDFVLMLYRLAGSPAVAGSTYADVVPGSYYYNSAIWAYRNNIMRNVTVNGLYDPDSTLTRQDFAQILFNYTAAMGGDTTYSGSISQYLDASSVSANTLEGVTWAVSKGYITSTVVGRLYIEPKSEANRAAISTLLHRYLTY